MLFFDPFYLVFALPGLLLAMWAQARVRSAFGHYSQVPSKRRVAGAQVASDILTAERITGVRIDKVRGFLTDHYDPRTRTLGLSPEVYEGRTIAAAGIAAHEVGHAIQHARSYPFLTLRSQLVPLVQIASNVSMPLLFVGLVLQGFGGLGGLGSVALWVGLAFFAAMVVFQLVTLPVEFDASRRALLALERTGLLRDDELVGARKVLSAAALTYVAAAVTAALQLLYFLWRSGLLGGRRD